VRPPRERGGGGESWPFFGLVAVNAHRKGTTAVLASLVDESTAWGSSGGRRLWP
jgi:hypothetical protein